MNGSPIGTLEDAETVAASVLSGVHALQYAEWWRFGRDELLAAGQMIESLARSVYAAQVRWVGEAENAGTADQLQVSSTKVLLREVLRIAPGDASDRVRAARRLLDREPLSGGEIPAELPIVAKALDAGDIGPGHVAVITKAVAWWPAELEAETRLLAEQLLVDQALQVDSGQLTKVAQQLEQGGPARRVRPICAVWTRTAMSPTSGTPPAPWNSSSACVTRAPD